jgi:hypothetical protein
VTGGSGRRTRTRAEVIAAENDLYLRVWYARHMTRRGSVVPTLAEYVQGDAAAAAVEDRFAGSDMPLLGANADDVDLLRQEGQLAALRWVLGSAWNDDALYDT